MVCNFRKTRKRGGEDQIATTVLKCVGPFNTKAKCLDEFLKQHQFYKIDIPGDGNCFYKTIVKYLELTNNTQYPKDHLKIRKMVVDALEDNIQEVSAYLPINNSNINMRSNNYNSLVLVKQLEALDRLRQNNVWNSDTADLVIQYASRALNMTINIYDFKAAIRARKGQVVQPAQINRFIIRPIGISRITINMLRVDNNHFNLLFPVANVAPAVAAIISALASAPPTAPTAPTAPTPRRRRPLIASPPIGNIDLDGPLPRNVFESVIADMSIRPKKVVPAPIGNIDLDGPLPRNVFESVIADMSIRPKKVVPAPIGNIDLDGPLPRNVFESVIADMRQPSKSVTASKRKRPGITNGRFSTLRKNQNMPSISSNLKSLALQWNQQETNEEMAQRLQSEANSEALTLRLQAEANSEALARKLNKELNPNREKNNTKRKPRGRK